MPRIIKKANRLVFSYGSNLYLEQMKDRCPGAVAVRRLTIKGWKLVFRGSADMQPGAASDVIHGALYSVNGFEEASLDAHEGATVPGRGLYAKVEFTITATGEQAFFYVMRAGDICPPSREYFETIRQGYRDWRLPRQSLNEARDFAKAEAELAVRRGDTVVGRGRGARA